ncbi:carbohydrate kinase [Polaribacter sp. HL-MS24]|uniref:carbohydrate kinase family protein n=1 Tax=Polaribacter sp. HL-MS24 TaxID=3077735 RepID=UPI00293512BB|nr:carbohydrate kinase [Polaribacter sp. HL-MS24]WOC40557.1 carbohydrate kinase [Polaribacter sp. HL-MS24]
MSSIVCFGEVLWDVFPSYKMIGGAPLNVALRLNSLENDVTIISSVGKDVQGEALLDDLKEKDLSTTSIQLTGSYKTSEVLVSIDDTGSASYTIEFPCAWDFISLNNATISAVQSSDAFVFGSLIARSEMSFTTLLALLDVAVFKVFDVNLRPPHYEISTIDTLMQKADFIKFNDEELFEICKSLGFQSTNVNKSVEFISKQTNTNKICVTLGAKGALLFVENIFYFNEGYQVQVKDTVGAGDSFLAALIHQLLENVSAQKAIDFACAVGAIVASSSGANPKISDQQITDMLHA